MKRIITLTLVVCLSSLGLFAAQVTQTTAEKAAINVFASRTGIDANQVSIVDVFAAESNNQPVYYVFNMAPEGYVIIAAEDAFYPVIAWSDEGSFSEINAPQSLIGWMGKYIDNINYLRENNIQADQEIALKWEKALTYDTQNAGKYGEIIVDSFLPAVWNQDSPYNWYAPEAQGGPGGKAYAGCVATAMSMVMYYWRWPWEGEGSHSYYAGSYGTLSADFGNSYYDYYGMPTASDNKFCHPIALLMYHCAVAVDMDFSPDGSGAYSFDVPNAVKSYFKYDNSAQHVQRGSIGSWIVLLRDQLDLGYPLYYSGQSSSGGHAFVCDGYTDDFYFHFNFGWSGSGNGWFELNDVGGYSSSNAIIKNYIPDQSIYAPSCDETVVITAQFGSVVDCSNPAESYAPNVTQSWLIDPQTALDSITDIDIMWKQFALASGDKVTVYDGEDDSAPVLGEFTGTDLPEDLTSTGNKLFVVFETDGSGEDLGFYFDFKSTLPTYCSGVTTLTDFAGTITDGSLDFDYNNSSSCMWLINVETAISIGLDFVSFDLEDGNDVVKIYDAVTNEQVAEYTGTTIPDELNVATTQLLIAFNTNKTITGEGFEINYSASVGVEDVEALQNLSVSPNPAVNMLNVNFNLAYTGDVTVSLFDMSGKRVFSDKNSAFRGTYNNNIDISNLSKGVYILNVVSDRKTESKRVVIK